jgi:dihydrosphingosine 1-phosphate phosphatase
VSIGPQSAADAYETIAYRQKRRRESLESLESLSSKESRPTSPKALNSNHSSVIKGHRRQKSYSESQKNIQSTVPGTYLLPTPLASRVHSYERMMGAGADEVLSSPATPPVSDEDYTAGEIEPFPKFEPDYKNPEEEDEEENRKIFLSVQRPRVRYDVEVVTKLIVYSGIAWLAVEGNPRFFEAVGLGLGGAI